MAGERHRHGMLCVNRPLQTNQGCSGKRTKSHVPHDQARQKPDQPGSCPVRQPYRGAGRKYGASKLSFPDAKQFLRKLSAIRARLLQNFGSSGLRGKSSTNNSLSIKLTGVVFCGGESHGVVRESFLHRMCHEELNIWIIISWDCTVILCITIRVQVTVSSCKVLSKYLPERTPLNFLKVLFNDDLTYR